MENNLGNLLAYWQEVIRLKQQQWAAVWGDGLIAWYGSHTKHLPSYQGFLSNQDYNNSFAEKASEGRAENIVLE